MTLDCLYNAFLKAENRVGGGEGLVGIYGSMTQHGTCSIMGAMAQHAGLSHDSILVDIGSGLCRPLLHAYVEYGVHQTFGVELDAVKCQKALPFVRHTATMMAAEGLVIPESALPTVICASAEQMGSLEPATHAYAAWEGFPEDAKESIGELFRCTRSLKAITIVQRSLRNQDPVEVMEQLGFGLVECKAAALPVFMAGSGRKLNAYLFVKVPNEDTAQVHAVHRAGPSLLTATPFTTDQAISERSRASGPAGSPTSEHGPTFTGTGRGLRPRKNSSSSASTDMSQHRASSTELSEIKGLALASPQRPAPSHVMMASQESSDQPTPASHAVKKPPRGTKARAADAAAQPDQTKAQGDKMSKVSKVDPDEQQEGKASQDEGSEIATRKSGRTRKPARLEFA